jgi:glycosyltransferase involved in cell wall biosynthesis
MTASLVLPCYKPLPGWEQHVYTGFRSFCQAAGQDIELVVVLDGENESISNDALQYLKEHIPGMKLVGYAENRGKGHALRQGVVQATGEIIMYTDIDFPYTPDSMLAVYTHLKNNEADVAIGVKNNSYYTHVPFLRRIISRFLRALIRLCLSMPITDTQCGLKGFKKSVAPLFLQTTIDRYLFDLEFVRNCFKSKQFRVKAVPVALNENIRFREMDYRILLPEMLNFVKLLFR